MKYAKAYAAALSTIIVYVALQFGLNVPEEVSAAVAVVLTPVVVAVVPNKKETPPPYVTGPRGRL